jgi:pilus assembly protein CpaC
VSRTKLRRFGFDFSKITGANVVTSTPGGGLSSVIDTAPSDGTKPWVPLQAQGSSGTLNFGIVSGSNAFLGVLDALRRDNLIKIMAEPTLVTESGRAASFNSGGEIPVPVPQSLGTTTIEWKKYGTQIDFVPIVLGNGKIRLEVRPRVSELDSSHSIVVLGTTVEGIKVREADTAVELTAGQTLAIAGLVQSRIESQNSGLPWISEVPYLGVPFRKVNETVNEIELLIMVTPEIVDGMDANEVPQCGPGMNTTTPTDWELFMKGHLEVPNCCPADGNGKCSKETDGSPTPVPEDGMIGPEQIQTPSPSGAKNTQRPGIKNMPGASSSTSVAKRNGGNAKPYSPQNSSKTNNQSNTSSSDTSNNPPGFIGPVGYDVVK